MLYSNFYHCRDVIWAVVMVPPAQECNWPFKSKVKNIRVSNGPKYCGVGNIFRHYGLGHGFIPYRPLLDIMLPLHIPWPLITIQDMTLVMYFALVGRWFSPILVFLFAKSQWSTKRIKAAIKEEVTNTDTGTLPIGWLSTLSQGGLQPQVRALQDFLFNSYICYQDKLFL